MFSTFTTEHGALIIRTQDIRRIEDVQRRDTTECIVAWLEAENSLDPQYRTIAGTAAENLARIIVEEQARVAAYNTMQQRAIETATWQIKRSFPRWLRWLIR